MNNSTRVSGKKKKERNLAYIRHFWSFLSWHKQKERFKLPGLKRDTVPGPKK